MLLQPVDRLRRFADRALLTQTGSLRNIEEALQEAAANARRQREIIARFEAENGHRPLTSVRANSG